MQGAQTLGDPWRGDNNIAYTAGRDYGQRLPRCVTGRDVYPLPHRRPSGGMRLGERGTRTQPR
jgi:hypothetical protein